VISPACRALNSKPAVAPCWDRLMNGQTDGRTDSVPLYRPRSAYYAGSAKKQCHPTSSTHSLFVPKTDFSFTDYRRLPFLLSISRFLLFLVQCPVSLFLFISVPVRLLSVFNRTSKMVVYIDVSFKLKENNYRPICTRRRNRFFRRHRDSRVSTMISTQPNTSH